MVGKDNGVGVVDDPSEQVNLVEREPAMVRAMESELREWQRSSLESLMGLDYQ